jgi:hypothetical protein
MLLYLSDDFEEYTMIISFPLWYKIFLGWFGLTIITGIFRRLSKNKIIEAIKKSPKENVEKIVNSYSKLLKIYKIYLLAFPLTLILLPYLTYVYSRYNLFHTTSILLLMYVVVIEDYFFRRSIVRETM